MSVKVSDRHDARNLFLASLIRLNDQCLYLFLKLKTPVRPIIGQPLIDNANMALNYAVTANSIWLGDSTTDEMYNERRNNFKMSVDKLMVLETYISRAYSLHMNSKFPGIRLGKSNKKVDKMIQVLVWEVERSVNLIKKVIESDKERYKQIKLKREKKETNT